MARFASGTPADPPMLEKCAALADVSLSRRGSVLASSRVGAFREGFAGRSAAIAAACTAGDPPPRVPFMEDTVEGEPPTDAVAARSVAPMVARVPPVGEGDLTGLLALVRPLPDR